MKKFLTLLTLLFIPLSLRATTVTGTVHDPNGNVYGNGIVTADFVPSPSGGSAITPSVVSTTNASGVFSITLTDNNTLAPANSKWNIAVCSASGTVCTHSGPVTITGASQDISTQLNAMAPFIQGALLIAPVTFNSTSVPIKIYMAPGQTSAQLSFFDYLGNAAGMLGYTTLPVASPANVLSFVTSGGNTTATCDITSCGVSATQNIFISYGIADNVPNACTGPFVVGSTLGNTATWPNSNACNGTAAFGHVIGTPSQVLNCINFAGNPSTSGWCWIPNFDGEMNVFETSPNGAVNSKLRLDTNGPVALVDVLTGGGMYVLPTTGDTCLGIANYNSNPASCSYFDVDTTGALKGYKGWIPGAGNGIINDFCKFTGRQQTNVSQTCTLAASGYGTQGLVLVMGDIFCSVAPCSAQTGQISVTFKDPVGTALTYNTCNTSLGCITNGAGSATTFTAVGVHITFVIPITVATSVQQTFTISTTVSGFTSTSQYDAYLHAVFLGN